MASWAPKLEGGLNWGLLGLGLDRARARGRISKFAVDHTMVSFGISLIKPPYRSSKSFFFFFAASAKSMASPPKGKSRESIIYKYPLGERSRKYII